jgi:hypothetical protein
MVVFPLKLRADAVQWRAARNCAVLIDVMLGTLSLYRLVHRLGERD